jgi:hypothetical protein
MLYTAAVSLAGLPLAASPRQRMPTDLCLAGQGIFPEFHQGRAPAAGGDGTGRQPLPLLRA